METSTVCTKNTFVCTLLTEMPTDQPRELSNDQTPLALLDNVIEVGEVVIFMSYSFYFFYLIDYLTIFHSTMCKLIHATLTNQSIKCRAKYLSNLQSTPSHAHFVMI